MSKRLLAANPSISEQSGHILLERGLVKVEGGMRLICSTIFQISHYVIVAQLLTKLTVLILFC